MNRGASSRGAVCDNRSSRISNIFYVFLSVKSINRIYREQTYKGIRGEGRGKWNIKIRESQLSYTREVERSWDIQYETGEVRDMSERVRKELEGKYYKKQGDRGKYM